MSGGNGRSGSVTVTTDVSRFELDRIYGFLSREAYWCKGLPRQVFDRSVAHSLCFGAFTEEGRQAGFARIIGDEATFAYLCDVFVYPEFRGRGISKAMMEAIVAHPALQGLRRLMLATADASELYARYGFRPLARPERMMEIADPQVYQRQGSLIA